MGISQQSEAVVRANLGSVVPRVLSAARLGRSQVAVIGSGRHRIEDIAVDTDGAQVVNVCLDKPHAPADRRASLDRLFNRVNATTARDSDFAFVVIAGGEDDLAVRLCRRLRNYNPVPCRYGVYEDGWSTRNVPIEWIVGGPVFRSSESDCLLQIAGLVAQALLWQEEPSAPAHRAREWAEPSVSLITP